MITEQDARKLYNARIERVEATFQTAIQPFREVYNQEMKSAELKYYRLCLPHIRAREKQIKEIAEDYKKALGID